MSWSSLRSNRALAINGGPAVRGDTWPMYDNGHAAFVESDIDAAVEAMRSGRLFRYDDRPYAETEAGRLEAEVCDHFATGYALACSSGTAAIALALMALGVGPGDIVICPAFTFAATPSAIELTGAAVRLVGIDDDLHLDVAELADLISPEVKAIVVVHMRGFASDMQEILRLADDAGIPVVEDAVPALGVELDGRKLGCFGAAGAFSTQSDKTLNTGEGGFLVTDDEALYRRAVVLSGAHERRVDRHPPDGAADLCDMCLPMYSFRLDEVRAAVARNQLRRLDERILQQQQNHELVVEALGTDEGIRQRQPVAPRAYLGASLNFRLLGTTSEDVEWVAEALVAEGVGARALGSSRSPNVRAFWNWHFAFPGLSPDAIKALSPNSARRLSEVVDIPLAPQLTNNDLDQLVEAIGKVTSRSGHLAADLP